MEDADARMSEITPMRVINIILVATKREIQEKSDPRVFSAARHGANVQKKAFPGTGAKTRQG
jgi:hypothetical protein